jgi:hypothetical protein
MNSGQKHKKNDKKIEQTNKDKLSVNMQKKNEKHKKIQKKCEIVIILLQ